MANETPQSKELPEDLATPYKPGDEFFVYRKPFLINRGVEVADPDADEIVEGTGGFGQEIQKNRISDKDVFIGVAGLKSFDLLALAGAETTSSYQNAVLYDVNVRQLQAMGQVLELIRNNESPEDFKKAYAKLHAQLMDVPETIKDMGVETTNADEKAALQEEHAQYYSSFGVNKAKYQPQTEQDVKKYFKKIAGDKHSWLQSDNYRSIRRMVENNKIKLANMDLRDQSRVRELNSWLGDEKLRVGHIYISSTMDFMDPQLQTDYYSKDAGVEKARDFYMDLLTIVGDKGKFIVSVTDPEQEFMEDYYLQLLTTKEFDRKASEQVRKDPLPSEKRHDFMFNAGGQVWRIMSIEGQKNTDGSPGTRYFRVSSERPIKAKDVGVLQEQIKDIDKVIENITPELKKQKLPAIIDPKSLDGMDTVVGISNTRDFQYFARQEELANRIAMMKRAGQDETHSIQLSSKPFMIQTQTDEDPSKTLRVLQKSIQEKLGRGVDIPEQEPPQIHIKPDAQRYIEGKGRGVPPSSHTEKLSGESPDAKRGR